MLSSSKEHIFVSSNKLILKFKFNIFKNMCQTGCQAMKVHDMFHYYYYYCHIHSNTYQRLLKFTLKAQLYLGSWQNILKFSLL